MRRLTQILAMLLICIALSDDALASPQSVLIIDQSELSSPVALPIRAAIRSVLNGNTNLPYTMYFEPLDVQRFRGGRYWEITYDYLKEKYRDKTIDLIIAIGPSALEFISVYRSALWPSAPIIFGMIDDAVIGGITLHRNVTGITIHRDFEMVVSAARIFVIDLERIVLVGGSPEADVNRHHYTHYTKNTPQVEVIDYTQLPMNEVKSRIGALPERTALYYSALYNDPTGKPYVPEDALAEIAKIANRPIIIDSEIMISHGASGGFVLFPQKVGLELGILALRILSGADVSQIPVSSSANVKPVFSWLALQNWSVDVSRLPPGSEIRFRPPDAWDLYRWQIIGIVIVISVLLATSLGLFYEHRRFRAAEAQSKSRLQQMAHMDRTLIAGAMSASIAHELNQPLGAILANSETAQIVLNSEKIDVNFLKEILADIERDDKRAADIIGHLRGLLKKRSEGDIQVFDLNKIIKSAVEIIAPDAKKRKVTLTAVPEKSMLPVRADHVHLQQVIINLVLNAMDAMKGVIAAPNITVSAALVENGEVEVSVTDTGMGIPADKIAKIFEPFFTTKVEGTGLGLSIARTIIESYGGRIWAENRLAGGASVRFKLPLAEVVSS